MRDSYRAVKPLIPYTGDGDSCTCVLDGPTARRGTLISNPPLGSFSPLRQGSFGGSRPPSQSQIVFRIAWRTLEGVGEGKNSLSLILPQNENMHCCAHIAGTVSEVGTYTGGVTPESYLAKSCWLSYVGWLHTMRYMQGHVLIRVTQINTWDLHYIEGHTDLIRTFFFFLTACLSGSRRVTWAKSCRAA